MTQVRPHVQLLAFPSNETPDGAKRFYEEIESMLGSGTRRLIFEMSAITRMGPAKLAVLIEAIELVQKLGGEVALLKPRLLVCTILELTRIHRMVDIFDQEATAICRMSGSFQTSSAIAA